MENALERREQIAERLRLRRQDTVSNLAAEFGVCERTIRYDLMTLSISYPITTIQGSGGGVVWTGKRSAAVYTEREIEAIRNAIKVVSPEDAAVLERMIAVHSVREPFAVQEIFKILGNGISQVELADKLGISKGALSNIMARRRTPSAELHERISKLREEVIGKNEGD